MDVSCCLGESIGTKLIFLHLHQILLFYFRNMLLTIQNNFEVFKYKNSNGFINSSSNKKKYALNTRKTYQISELSNTENNGSFNKVLTKDFNSSSFVSLKRKASTNKNQIIKISPVKAENVLIKNLSEEFKSPSIETLNFDDDDLEIATQLNYQSPKPTPLNTPRVQSRCSVKSPLPQQSTHRLTPLLNNFNIKEKIRIISSAPSKHVIKTKNTDNVNSSAKKKHKEIINEAPHEFKLEELCDKPKYPRFIAYLSVDAQFAMLKAYEDTLYQELYSLYPHVDVIPKTSSPRFIASQSTNNNYNDSFFKQKNSGEQFNVTEEEKIKISHFIESAMKILDYVREYKKSKAKKEFYKENDSEEENEDKTPLSIYIQWIKLWNREFL